MTTSVDADRSDFNVSDLFDVGADILWRDHAGDNVLWLMNNNTPSVVAPLAAVPPDWHLKAAAEFDSGNGNADILWQNDNGGLALWQMNGTTVTAINPLPNPGPTWHVVGDNNFDTVGTGGGDDILFQNDNGAVVLWTGISAATGTVSNIFASTLNPGPDWRVVGTGDTTGDGKAGILWQNDNGALVMWEDSRITMNLRMAFDTVAALPTVDPSWHVKGMADFSGDGRSDIVFQHDSGAVAVWEMSGTTISATNLVNLNPGPAWHIVGMRDMDGDGNPDILFQNDSGAAAVWEGYAELGGGSATFHTVLAINPNPNPNGHVWDLL